MSGGYFDRNIYAIGEIVASIERDIARALRPKPEKIHKDYWTIYVKDSFGSYHSYMGFLSFSSYEEAESFLLTDKTIVKAEQKYSDQHFFAEGIIFQSTKRYMSDRNTAHNRICRNLSCHDQTCCNDSIVSDGYLSDK